jgi:hypothetical protein
MQVRERFRLAPAQPLFQQLVELRGRVGPDHHPQHVVVHVKAAAGDGLGIDQLPQLAIEPLLDLAVFRVTGQVLELAWVLPQVEEQVAIPGEMDILPIAFAQYVGAGAIAFGKRFAEGGGMFRRGAVCQSQQGAASQP